MESIYCSDKWELLVPDQKTGVIELRPENVQLRRGEDAHYNSSFAEHLDKVWDEGFKEAREKGYVLTNGQLARYSGHSIKNGCLTLDVGKTNFKEFIGTNVFLGDGGRLKLQPTQMSNPISVLSTILTNDDNTVVSFRNKSPSYKADFYSLFGRGLREPQELIDGRVHLFNLVKNIVSNELKLSSNDVGDPSLVGLNHSLFGFGDYSEYMLLFKMQIQKNAKELMNRKNEIVGKNRKYKDIRLIPLNNGDELKRFLNENHYSFVGTGEPGLVLLGREKFGEEWTDNLNYAKVSK
jgi:hypothetical protein